MVKFAKELESELVPEWQEAYCTYAELKNDLKRIQHHRNMGPTYTRTGTSLGILRSIASTKAANLTRTFTRTFSSRTPSPRTASPRTPSPRSRPEFMASLSVKPGVHSKDVIAVTKRKTDDGEVFMTQLHEPLSISPQDRTYFARLDSQVTKVNKFYKKKETENIARAGVLEKKMYELIHAQEVIAREGIPAEFATPFGASQQHHDAHMTQSSDNMQNRKELSDELPLISEDSDRSESFLMEPSGRPTDVDEDDGEIDDSISRYIIDQTASKNLKSGSTEARKESAASGSILKLRSVVKTASSVVPEPIEEEKEMEYIRGSDVENQKTYTQKELDEAKKLLRRAFVDFYRSLTLLSSYRSVNINAFAKITKKYDAITGWQIAPTYMKEVETSHFVISKKIHKLATKVEDIFTKHFVEGDRKKAMAQLRPVRKQGTHRTTFVLGLFSGASVALLISFFFLVSNPLALDKGGGIGYLNTVFPVFSTMMLIAIHIYFYGWNVYAWQRTRINYPFIFEFSPGTELRFREVLLIATGFTTFLLSTMNIHIAMTLLTHQDPPVSGGGVPAPAPSALQQDYSTAVDVIPLILFLITLLVVFFPFNIFYRSSRMFFLRCFKRLVIAPLVKVKLSDFFLGDQFTSQVLVFRNLEYVACYYSGGFFLTNQQDHVCKKNSVYQGFGYVVAILPYWWRFLQCLRRWVEEKDVHQRDNAAKYFSAIVAVGLRQAYTNYRGRPAEVPLLVLMIVASIVATVFTTYWDLWVDWGLCKKESRNKWLRDKLILKNKSWYFVAMGANSVLRLAWLATLIQAPISLGLNQNAFDVCMAVLEILRRGIWNFFRIENEHLNNVGKYRAEKAVPLPFNDDM